MNREDLLPWVGVVGTGMVGNALIQSFRHHTRVLSYDVKHGVREHGPAIDHLVLTATPWETLTGAAEVIFLCVPTPMHPDGTQDLSILESVLAEIGPRFVGGVVVVKSTVEPGTTLRLQAAHPGLQLVFNPEFLREQTAVEDFRTQDRVILGTDGPTPELTDLYQASHPKATIWYTDPTTAELVKYTANCFLATKVSFANEIAQLAGALGVHYPELVELVTTDARIGKSHWQVPGPDGHKGFGLTCFPKDINALITSARAHGVRPTVLEAVWEKNLEVRPERDWEQMHGRAVSAPPAPSSATDGP